MTAEERVATLNLYGCTMIKRDPTGEKVWRAIVLPPFDTRHNRPHLRYVWYTNASAVAEKKWIYSDKLLPHAVETPFEPGLIELIPENMFVKFIESLTR